MTSGVPGLGEVVQLAAVVRSGFVVSRHFGLAVALGPDDQILYAAGRPARRPPGHRDRRAW